MEESRRRGRYLLAAVLVPTTHVHLIAGEARRRLPAGRRRAHFSDEGDAVRRRILDAYVGLGVGALVVQAPYSGGDDQIPRERCLDMLLPALVASGAAVVAFDTRGPGRDERDRKRIEHLRRRHPDLDGLHYVHRGSRDEVLLGLPDAVAWAYGAGGAWLRRIRPILFDELEA